MDIKTALEIHHNTVKEKGYDPIMTVLVGSQNYGLETPNSDYDTFTFVKPTVSDIATLRNPVSKTFEDELGHIDVKDIRLGLNLLKKTNPNSIECFATKHKYVEVGYEALNNLPWYAFRCDTKHMMMALGGMAHQLGKRNMSAGKRYSHLIRINCMLTNYFDIGSSMGRTLHSRSR